MYSSASGGGTSAPSTLPIGWTAYTDPATNQTYYVHLPTGDTQWTRPPPPPPPPPQQQQQLSNQVAHPPPHHVHNYNAYNSVTPTAPPQSQSMTQYPPHHSNSSYDISPWNNYTYHNYNNQATSSFNNNYHQHHQPPPTLSLSYDPNWQPKRRRLDYNSHNNNNYHHPPPYPKRTKVEQTNNDEGNNNRTRKCSKCGFTKTWESYSKRQWTSGEEARKCKTCVEEDITVHDEQTQKKQEIDSAAAARTKVCSSCQTECSWESYSKRQWTTSVDMRKCKNCVEKSIAVLPSAEATAAEMKDRTKICSSCETECPWESFSKRQWTTSEEFRKCKVCVEKSLQLLESANNENNACSTSRSEEVAGDDKGEVTESAEEVKAEQSLESNGISDGTTGKMESETEVVARDENIEGGSAVESVKVKAEETLLDHDTTAKSTESKANMNAMKADDDDDDKCTKIDTTDFLVNSKTINNKPPKDDDDDAAEAEPLYPCSKCNKHLSKSLYTTTQWKKKTSERKCNSCVIHPSPKKVKVEQPSLEAKYESNGNEQEEVSDCCNKTVLSPVMEVKEENICNSTDISPVVEVKTEEVAVKQESE